MDRANMTYKDKEKRRQYCHNNNKLYANTPNGKTKRNKAQNRYSKTLKGKKTQKKASNKWMKNNPEKVLEIRLRYLQNLDILLNPHNESVIWALNQWSKTIRSRDDNKCQLCLTVEDMNMIESITGIKNIPEQENKPLHSHHILYKSNYPKLAFNINNGITSCENHHHEVHMWRGD
jgi:hypothetical protein